MKLEKIKLESWDRRWKVQLKVESLNLLGNQVGKLLLNLKRSMRSEAYQLRSVFSHLNPNFLTSLSSFQLNQKLFNSRLSNSTFFPTNFTIYYSTRSPKYDLHRSNVTFDPIITNLVVKLDERKVPFLSLWIVFAVYTLNFSELQFDWLKRNQIFQWPIDLSRNN